MTALRGRVSVPKSETELYNERMQQSQRRIESMVEYKAKNHSVLQSELAELATRWKDMRFMRLYDLLWKREWLEEALSAVLSNKGSVTAGVDKMTIEKSP